jgi:hypothetical protein
MSTAEQCQVTADLIWDGANFVVFPVGAGHEQCGRYGLPGFPIKCVLRRFCDVLIEAPIGLDDEPMGITC